MTTHLLNRLPCACGPDRLFRLSRSALRCEVCGRPLDLRQPVAPPRPTEPSENTPSPEAALGAEGRSPILADSFGELVGREGELREGGGGR